MFCRYLCVCVCVSREITQLRKDFRKKDHMIRTLQADARRKELVLKRKQDEVTTLFLCLACAPSYSCSSLVLLSFSAHSLSLSLSLQVSALRRQRFARSQKMAIAKQKKEMASQLPSNVSSPDPAGLTAVVRRNGVDRPSRLKRRLSSVFSSEGARQKWRKMEKMVGGHRMFVCLCLFDCLFVYLFVYGRWARQLIDVRHSTHLRKIWIAGCR